MKFLKLRVVGWVLCAIVAALLCAMWLRSYWWIDSLDSVSTTLGAATFRLVSVSGRTTLTLGLEIFEEGDDSEIVYNCVPINPQTRYLEFWRVLFRINQAQGRCHISVPYWLSILLVAALAAVVPRLRWRFTLRTLLIAMAAVSLLLWIVISTIRR
jgi:hypothetical protein